MLRAGTRRTGTGDGGVQLLGSAPTRRETRGLLCAAFTDSQGRGEPRWRPEPPNKKLGFRSRRKPSGKRSRFLEGLAQPSSRYLATTRYMRTNRNKHGDGGRTCQALIGTDQRRAPVPYRQTARHQRPMPSDTPVVAPISVSRSVSRKARCIQTSARSSSSSCMTGPAASLHSRNSVCKAGTTTSMMTGPTSMPPTTTVASGRCT